MSRAYRYRAIQDGGKPGFRAVVDNPDGWPIAHCMTLDDAEQIANALSDTPKRGARYRTGSALLRSLYAAPSTPKRPAGADDPDLLVGDVSVAVEYMLGKIPDLPSKGSPQFQQIVSALTSGYVFGRCTRGAA